MVHPADRTDEGVDSGTGYIVLGPDWGSAWGHVSGVNQDCWLWIAAAGDSVECLGVGVNKVLGVCVGEAEGGAGVGGCCWGAPGGRGVTCCQG